MKIDHAILFDLDGTLADSEVWWKQIDSTFLSKHGVKYADEHHQALVGVSAPNAILFFKSTYGLGSSPEDLLRRYHEIAVEFYATRIEPFPQAAEVLQAVHAMGLRIALVTSTDRRVVLPFLERHNLASQFEVIVSGDQVTQAKPAPDIYLLAAQKLGISPDLCIAVEDSHAGVRAARAAGMTVVAIPDARWSERAHFQDEAHFLADDLQHMLSMLRMGQYRTERN